MPTAFARATGGRARAATFFLRGSAALFLFCVSAGDVGAQTPVVKIYHVDIGQGDATLVIGPTGKTCLIDAGDVGHGTGQIIPLLNQLGVTQLDFSVASHWHSDHYGAFIELKNNGFWPVVAYDRGLDASLNGQFLYSNYVAAMGGHRATLAVGALVDLGGGATLQCVCVDAVPLGGSSVPLGGTAQIENNRSVVVKLSFGNFQAVVGGDLEGGFNGTADVESAAAAAVGDVDLYKVHHHGSDTSTNSLWLSTIKPEIAVISCGDNNPYGHPHQNVVTALLATPQIAAVYRLNTCDPSTLTPGNPIQQVVLGTLLVTTDGAAYTMTGPGIAPLTRNVDEGGPAATYAPLDVVISEFMPNPKGASGLPIADADGEWIELRNNLPTAVNLLGFTIRDAGVDSFTLPSVNLPAFGYVTIGRNANVAVNGGLVFDYVAPANELVLANSSDEIELVAPGGVVLDALTYGGASGISVPNGVSVERKNARAPAWASNFAVSSCCYWPTSATPCVCSGASTQHNFGTPRAANTADATPPYAFFSTAGARFPGSLFTLNLTVFGSGGKSYVMAASLATAPPFVLSDGRSIDMAYDFLMLFSLTPGNGVFSGMTGVMNGFGSGQGAVLLPPDPALSGLGFYAGGLVYDPSHATGIGSISDPLFVQIQWTGADPIGDAEDDAELGPDPASADAPPPGAVNWRATVAYDGTRFCGWERQKNGLGVQEALEDALFRLSSERVVVHGSGRTDAGVHALGQVASFRLMRRMSARKLRVALNALLPHDVAVTACEEASPTFHARFDARRKTYRYDVLNGPVRRPLIRHRVFHFPQKLDAERMDRAARALEGTHDFRAFAKESHRRKTCVRTIYEARVAAEVLDPETNLLSVELTGSGFLYNMVRIVVGTLIDVGLGRRPESCFAELTAGGLRAEAGFTVPPTGLVLVRVEY